MSDARAVAVPVLTYHAMNVNGRDYADNDHVALARDLEWLHAHDWRIVPLRAAVSALFDDLAVLHPDEPRRLRRAFR